MDVSNSASPHAHCTMIDYNYVRITGQNKAPSTSDVTVHD